MTTLLQQMIARGVFQCPRCGSTDWSRGDDVLRCTRCGGDAPVVNGVPDFFNSYAGEERRRPHVREVDQLIAELDLPTDEGMRAAVVDILARSGRTTEDRFLTAELSDVTGRFGEDPGKGLRFPRVPRRANRNLAVGFERHYFPISLPVGTTVVHNVRVRNDGVTAWSSRTSRPLHLSSRWLDAAGGVLADGLHARFPVDVEPGRAITVPLSVRTPPRAGHYTLQILLVQERRSWFEGQTLDVEIDVTDEPAERVAGVEYGDRIRSYALDHEAGVDFLGAYIADRELDSYTLLEIGGGTSPQAAWLRGCSLVNMDVSLPLLELGMLYFGTHPGANVCFVCANALDPPFAPKVFDGVVMFSTLHHFAEPERLLERAKSLIEPGGFVGVLCEPVGTDLAGYETTRDLLKGINEQVFTVDEYLWMFDAAGLRVARARVDETSLKAILLV